MNEMHETTRNPDVVRLEAFLESAPRPLPKVDEPVIQRRVPRSLKSFFDRARVGRVIASV
mgnify:CR=1 FL=1